jgi:hypothetical protein
MVRLLVLAALVSSSALASYRPDKAYAFRANRDSAFTLYPSATTEIILNDEVYDTNGWYDNANGRFTPLLAGYYSCSVTGVSDVESVAAGDAVFLHIRQNGSSATGCRGYDSADDPNTLKRWTVSVTCDFAMNGTTDYVSFWGDSDAGNFSGSTTSTLANFMCHRIGGL